MKGSAKQEPSEAEHQNQEQQERNEGGFILPLLKPQVAAKEWSLFNSKGIGVFLIEGLGFST